VDLLEEAFHELALPDPQDLGEDFDRICFLLDYLLYHSPDIRFPAWWTIPDFTRSFLLGDDHIITPDQLAEVYLNLKECGFYSAYWQMALDYINLMNEAPLY
jgi:hypothetical protein